MRSSLADRTFIINTAKTGSTMGLGWLRFRGHLLGTLWPISMRVGPLLCVRTLGSTIDFISQTPPSLHRTAGELHTNLL